MKKIFTHIAGLAGTLNWMWIQEEVLGAHHNTQSCSWRTHFEQKVTSKYAWKCIILYKNLQKLPRSPKASGGRGLCSQTPALLL